MTEKLTADILAEYVEGVRRDIEALEERLTGEPDTDTYALNGWLEDILEAETFGRRSTIDGVWQVEGWRLLVAYGGPTVQVVGRCDTGGIEVVGWWGSDKVTNYTYAGAFAQAVEWLFVTD